MKGPLVYSKSKDYLLKSYKLFSKNLIWCESKDMSSSFEIFLGKSSSSIFINVWVLSLIVNLVSNITLIRCLVKFGLFFPGFFTSNLYMPVRVKLGLSHDLFKITSKLKPWSFSVILKMIMLLNLNMRHFVRCSFDHFI